MILNSGGNRMKRMFILLFALVLLVSSVAAYDITVTPKDVVARDNPFGHYDDELPSLHVTVMDNNNPVEDVTITLTITHVDNLILASGFPWYEGAELLSVTQFSEDGTLEVDALLFPLRGDYDVEVTVMDISGTTESQQFVIDASEPFEQSTMNGLIFLALLGVFGIIVGWVFGKDFASKGQGKIMTTLLVSILLVSILAMSVSAHGDNEEENKYENDFVTFYTNPGAPDIGEETTFTFMVRDENGNTVTNAVAHIVLANEEEGFDALDIELFSQTGTFSFNYGIFDGAPHVATIRVMATDASEPTFDLIEAEIPFAGVAHDPPLSAKIKGALVMLIVMLLGFTVGVCLRKMKKKGETHE
jgi:hypothetical protein